MATLIGNGAHADDIRESGVYIHHSWDHHSEYRRLPGPEEVIIGVNDPWLRAQISADLGIADHEWLHPHTWVGPGCDWEYGTHINYGVTMTRTTLGHHVTVSPGVTICGDVVVGDRVLIGAGATICDRVTIGDDVTIGAGCVVLPESVVDSGSTIVGVPAKHVATGVHVK